MAPSCGSTCLVEGGFYTSVSLPGNVVILVAFCLLAPTALYTGARFQTPVFSAALTTGILLEVLGFIGRVLLTDDAANTTYFLLSLLGTLVGPPFMALALVVILPHTLSVFGDGFSRLRPVLVGFFLQCLVVAAVIVQVVGTVFLVYELGGTSRSSAANVIAGGLGVQLAVLVVFLAMHLRAITKSSSTGRDASPKHVSVYRASSFKHFLRSTETSALLLTVYTAYRIAELTLGLSQTPFQSETAFLILCGALPAMACILLTLFHPGAAFGSAWTATSPRRLKRRRPPPVPVPMAPTGYVAHHAYDPQIAKTSPTTARHSQRQSRPPEVALNSSPGLPSNPKPVYSKLPSPTMSVPSSYGSPTTERRPSDAVGAAERKSVAPKRKNMVDAEALW